MEILRKSQYSGNIYVKDLDVTEEQLRQYEAGEGYLQDIFSNLSAADREFIKTGITDEEWKEIFGPEN